MQVTEDRKLLIAIGRSRKATLWQNKEILWSELLDKLATTTRTRESASEYARLSKTERDSIKDIGGFVGRYLKNDKRSNASIYVWKKGYTFRVIERHANLDPRQTGIVSLGTEIADRYVQKAGEEEKEINRLPRRISGKRMICIFSFPPTVCQSGASPDLFFGEPHL